MFRRMIALVLILALFAGAAPQALCEGMSAAEALFGEDYGDDAAADGSVSALDVASINLSDNTGTDESMYGANDTASASAYPTLQLGDMDGEDGVAYIVYLQNRLIELGYLADSADGYYGENTQQAVKEFQKSNGLEVTGIADPYTQQRLFGDLSTLVRASVDSTLYGSEVMRVQSALSQWGFMVSSVDGKMGENTREAIRDFKRYMAAHDPTFGVTPTPMPTEVPTVNVNLVFGEMPAANDELLEGANPITLTADGEIDELIMNYVDGRMPFQIFRQVVRNGDTGEEVFRVQRRLKSLKYLYAADGAYGGLTELALKYFQQKHGLNQTGIADQLTQEALFSPSALEAEEYVFPYKIIVDISDQRVYIGSWNGSQYKTLVKKFKCSTGKAETPTPLGTYQTDGKAGDEWYYFKDFNCYAKWATRIVGGILFHSITYNSSKRRTGSESSLGRRASHGCIRLRVEDAKWIYDNCPQGTTVVIQN